MSEKSVSELAFRYSHPLTPRAFFQVDNSAPRRSAGRRPRRISGRRCLRVVIGQNDAVEEVDHRADGRALGGLQRLLFLYRAKVRKSPLGLQPLPSARGSVFSVRNPSRERNRISVDPMEPAARITILPSIWRLRRPGRRHRGSARAIRRRAPLDVGDHRQRPDRRRRVLRLGEVVLVERVLGAVFAPDHAVAAVHARVGCILTGSRHGSSPVCAGSDRTVTASGSRR